jgi:hypothetical protein
LLRCVIVLFKFFRTEVVTLIGRNESQVKLMLTSGTRYRHQETETEYPCLPSADHSWSTDPSSDGFISHVCEYAGRDALACCA